MLQTVKSGGLLLIYCVLSSHSSLTALATDISLKVQGYYSICVSSPIFLYWKMYGEVILFMHADQAAWNDL
jgi:hypothetical protein